MATRINGYNIAFTSGGKIFGGTTSNGFDLTAITKESITKEDQGTKRQTVTGYESEFSVEGLSEVNASGEDTTRLDRQAIIDFILNGTSVPFSYGTSVSGTYNLTGTAVCTKFSESSNSEDEATFNASFKLSGALVKVLNS